MFLTNRDVRNNLSLSLLNVRRESRNESALFRSAARQFVVTTFQWSTKAGTDLVDVDTAR